MPRWGFEQELAPNIEGRSGCRTRSACIVQLHDRCSQVFSCELTDVSEHRAFDSALACSHSDTASVGAAIAERSRCAGSDYRLPKNGINSQQEIHAPDEHR